MHYLQKIITDKSIYYCKSLFMLNGKVCLELHWNDQERLANFLTWNHVQALEFSVLKKLINMWIWFNKNFTMKKHTQSYVKFNIHINHFTLFDPCLHGFLRHRNLCVKFQIFSSSKAKTCILWYEQQNNSCNSLK